MVYKAFHSKPHLVSEEYYKDELRYQDKIDGMANTAKLSDAVVSQDSTAVTIQLPKELNGNKIIGEAWFYCKTDEGKDKKFPLAVDSTGKQMISKNQLLKTAYQVKLSWKIDTTNYFTEKEIILK
jgi:glucan-binding YG repeat protein